MTKRQARNAGGAKNGATGKGKERKAQPGDASQSRGAKVRGERPAVETREAGGRGERSARGVNRRGERAAVEARGVGGRVERSAVEAREAGGRVERSAVEARGAGGRGERSGRSEQTSQRPSSRQHKQSGAATTGPFRKNEEVTVDIIGLTHDGEGVGRADGFTLFVQGALPGEHVRARVMKLKKQYGFARLEQLLVRSEDRLEPPCQIYNECGGCQLQHLDYAAQLRWKRQFVVDNLKRIGKLRIAGELESAGIEGDQIERDERLSADGALPGGNAARADETSVYDNDSNRAESSGVIVRPTVGMINPWKYRNKAAVPVGSGEGSAHEEGLIAGFYARGSHRIIDMDDCLIQHEHNDEVIRIVKSIARELRITPYDETNGTGVLRHVMARTGVVTGEIMIVLVTNGQRFPRKPEWIEHIRAAIPGVKSIVQNVNQRNTNAIFGDETKVLWGSEVIYDELDGLRFAISARSFYQVNPEQTVALYRQAVEYAGLTGNEKVIDAYCGIGTISLFLARKAAQVYGVEIVPEAIEDAARNAELNGIRNATFEAGPAEVVIPRWREEGVEADVIVVDPPRKGCDPALLDTILAIRPERVVYVSCNPSTLARDLRVLEDGGYRTVEVAPVDMFPWTVHVECVVGICRVDT